ncbi:MAG: ParB/RepB/Spo0J family partition protein [Gammaproteobacteria bacterium]|nr:ParB/RepB/Spo0J family partition protein [Gammaproteobacteria bacterium]MYD02750.1 ParB/RepB/Spo0J family partition protein [Gammaproteobacteria bacterium]MYI25837.1 ParB/RepB/Spo0J family partition protein [Gammaproteobacteria bacterium]
MAAPNRGLGRGLEALLGPARETAPHSNALQELPLDLLQPGRFQPRQAMDPEGIAELAESIRAQGVVQPVLARPVDGDGDSQARYEIVAGERRWRAAQHAGLESVPAVVRSLSDAEAALAALVENVQREDLNAMELARALRAILEISGGTHKEVGRSIGMSRAAVSNHLRLLELGDTAKELLAERKLEMGHGRALLAVTNPARQAALARLIAEKRLTVRDAERLAQAESRPKKTPAARDPNVVSLERDLSERWGAPVRIRHGKRGGRLEVRYKNLDELQGLLSRLP